MPFFKAGPQNKDIVRHRQVLGQAGLVSDDADPVAPPPAVVPVIHQLLVVIDIAVPQGQVLGQQGE